LVKATVSMAYDLPFDLEDARCFAEVVRAGGYTAASRVLRMPKSTLSRRLAKLESALGVQLLRRTTRSLSLTQAGEEFYGRVQRGMETLQEAGQVIRRETRDTMTGTIRITAPVNFANAQISGLLRRYHGEYPEVRVELLMTDRVLDLVLDRIDIALRAGAPVLDGTSESVIARKISTVDFVLVVAPEYLKGRGSPKTPEAFEEHDGIWFRPEGDGLMEWELHSGSRRMKLQPRQPYICDSLPLAHELSVAGCGIALLPSSICRQDIEDGRLLRLLPDWSGERTAAYLVYPKDKFQPIRVKKMLEAFQREFRVLE
jgi:DNA-binding transcriptional LysR family regulator